MTDDSGNRIAVAAFVLGIISIPMFLAFFIAIAAIICGVVGYRRAFYFGAPHGGLASWGLGLGILSLVWLLYFASTYTGDL